MLQLELYSWVAKDLQTWISNSKQIYQQAEVEVAEVVPLLFREFSLANDEGREALLVCVCQCARKPDARTYVFGVASIEVDQG